MGSQTGKSKSLRASKAPRTVQLVLKSYWQSHPGMNPASVSILPKTIISVQSDIQSDARNDIFVTLQLRSVQDKPETVSAVFMGNEVL